MTIILRNGSKTISILAISLLLTFIISIITDIGAGDDLYRIVLFIFVFSFYFITEEEKYSNNTKIIISKIISIFLLLFLSFYNYYINYGLLFVSIVILLYWIGRHFLIIKHLKHDDNFNEIIY